MIRIYKWLAGVVAIVALAIGLYLKGRNDGKDKERVGELQSDLEAEKRVNEISDTGKKISDAIDRMPSSDVQQRLRDKYTRD